MTSNSGRFLSGLTLGGTLIGLGYYLSKNQELTEQISTKVKDSFNAISENSLELKDKLMNKVEKSLNNSHELKDKLMDRVEKSLNNISETSFEVKDEFMDKFEDKLNALLENSYAMQGELMNMVNDTKSTLNDVLKDTTANLNESVDKTHKQFTDIVGRLTPALIALPPRRNRRFIRGLSLGSTLIGLGYYLYTNKHLSEQIATKVKDLLKSYEVQDKLMNVVNDTKNSLNNVLSDTKSSLGEGLEKTSKKLSSKFTRLTSAFNAGREAVRESLKNSKTDTDNINTRNLKDSVESPLGATEDTSTDNTSKLHPGSNNIAKSVGDAGTNFDKTTSGKTGSDRFGSDKFTGI